MIIIFGRRAYGRVDACGSEYAQTTFVHLYYVPLIPTSSFWVTHEIGSQRTGFAIPLHGKSVAAAYLRVWAPIAAVVAVSAAPVLVGAPLGLLLLALSAWAWSWRSVRGELARRRSDFNRLAYGMRCEPSAMSPEVRAQVGAALRARWDRVAGTRTPNDVGTFGATDPGEAVTAYGLLRLAAHEHGGREEHEAAERILRGTHDPKAAADGPYRDGAHPAPAAVHDQVAAAAATVEAQRAGAVNAAAAATKRASAPFVRAKRMGVVGGLIALAAFGGLVENARALGSVTTGTVEEVAAHGHDGEFATVTCDHATFLGELQQGSRTTDAVLLCTQGARGIGVVAASGVTQLEGPITGKLVVPDYADESWFAELRAEPGVAPMYLQVTSRCTAQAEAVLCILGLGVGLGLGGLAIRDWRRAKRATA